MPGPFIVELTELRALLDTIGTATVVVADDAIDTGAMMRSIVAMVEIMAPQATVIPFALTSTLGERLHPRQVHIFEDVVEYEDGDIGALSEDATLAMMVSLPAISVERDRWLQHRNDTRGRRAPVQVHSAERGMSTGWRCRSPKRTF